MVKVVAKSADIKVSKIPTKARRFKFKSPLSLGYFSLLIVNIQGLI